MGIVLGSPKIIYIQIKTINFRKSIKINFDEIGWTHILAPKEV